ncbi:hypothetical protein Golax_016742 [Gossypium laxum]|uniref:Leucine-rich repeat-containing N-terminal plant-type domain-containing protein n=1 Tax=Gossypium laxum TaxID=34288 RepID=A0A7J8YY36_9ROSI|nr:hypothetical protein [Gossypium laxum]
MFSTRTQAEALLQWKSSLSFSPPSLDSWSFSNLNNLCNWTFIICDGATGAVSQTDLSYGNLSGSIACFIFTPFANLTLFNLNSNNIDGSVPIAIGTLSNLSLFNNSLNGTIPFQVSNLQKLRYLDLGFNYFVDPDSFDFLGIPLLIHLGLAYNEFELEFPQFILNCHNLTFLDLSVNRLSGSIPESLYTNLSHLKYLSLCGPIPQTIWGLSNLEALQLFYNNLSSTIPLEVGNMKSLKSLDINTNIFHGELPDTISNLTNLNAFSVFTNRFSGKIPQNFGKNNPQLATWGPCRNLTNLQIERDKISSGIPAELGKLAQLGVLNLGANELTGDIPLELGGLSLLFNLNLSQNHLRGRIPQTVGNLVMLEYLDLSRNKFIGRISEKFENCKKLLSLNLSQNKLSGEIPRDLGSIPSSGVFRNATWNAFVGNLGLYEDVEGLTPCNSSATKRKSNSKKVFNAIIFPIYGILILAAIVVGVFLYHKQRKILDEQSKKSKIF